MNKKNNSTKQLAIISDQIFKYHSILIPAKWMWLFKFWWLSSYWRWNYIAHWKGNVNQIEVLIASTSSFGIFRKSITRLFFSRTHSTIYQSKSISSDIRKVKGGLEPWEPCQHCYHRTWGRNFNEKPIQITD